MTPMRRCVLVRVGVGVDILRDGGGWTIMKDDGLVAR